MESETAAFEAEHVFRFGRDRKAAGRNVAFVGIERYGANFVVEPLRPYLEDEGINAYTYSVKSSGNTRQHLESVGKALLGIAKEHDDTVIIDGTTNYYSGGIPRLPRSLQYCREILQELGINDISYWVPVPHKSIVVGIHKTEFTPVSHQSPQVILANPITDPKKFPHFPQNLVDHKGGYLDDPEKFGFQKTEIIFTKNGVEVLKSGRTEEEFVRLVQDQITAAIAKYT